MKTVLLFLISFAAYAVIAGQSSTNYTVQSEVFDGGGLRSTSSGYVNDGSFGGFGGTVTAPTSSTVARTGYAGQLYEVTAFTLTATTTNLNEGGSLALNAIQWIDDGTLSLASGLSQWNFTGPIASVSPLGIITAASVSQNTPASVQANLEGWSASLNLLVIDIGNSPLLPGYNQILGQVMNDGKMRLTFVGSNGFSYALERSFSLSPANWVPQTTNSAAVGGALVFTNNPVPTTNNFWRIRWVQ